MRNGECGMEEGAVPSAYVLTTSSLVSFRIPHSAMGSAPLGEAAEHLEAHALALLRVELRGEHVALADGRGEGRGVVGFGGHQRRVPGPDVVGVDEVDRGVRGQAGEG